MAFHKKWAKLQADKWELPKRNRKRPPLRHAFQKKNLILDYRILRCFQIVTLIMGKAWLILMSGIIDYSSCQISYVIVLTFVNSDLITISCRLFRMVSINCKTWRYCLPPKIILRLFLIIYFRWKEIYSNWSSMITRYSKFSRK